MQEPGPYLLYAVKVKSVEKNTLIKGLVTITVDGKVSKGSIGDPAREEYVELGAEPVNYQSFVNNEKNIQVLRHHNTINWQGLVVDFIISAETKSSVDIKVELRLPGKITNVAGFNIEDSNIQKVTEAMEALLWDPIYSDFTIVCEGKSFPCHKAILAARSETFKKMFASSMVEAQGNKSDVKMTMKALEAMMEFMYCGKVTKMTASHSELLEVADMYELPGLAALVFNKFETLDEVESVADVLIIADR